MYAFVITVESILFSRFADNFMHDFVTQILLKLLFVLIIFDVLVKISEIMNTL